MCRAVVALLAGILLCHGMDPGLVIALAHSSLASELTGPCDGQPRSRDSSDMGTLVPASARARAERMARCSTVQCEAAGLKQDKFKRALR